MKLSLGLLFGGKSAEHEISIISAKGIFSVLDLEKYTVLPIYIDRENNWHLCDENLHPVESYSFFQACGKLLPRLDVVFPALHGPFGEDGTIQGLLKMANIACVGPGVLGCAVSMDKDVMKRLLREAGIPIPNFAVFTKPPTFQEVEAKLGLPFFVKPANMGSSIGITKVESQAEFAEKMKLAFSYDDKIICEEAVAGAREIECSILEVEGETRVSLPGEIVLGGKVYSYEVKYIDKDSAKFDIPAKLTGEEIAYIQELAVKAFDVLCLHSMARIDLFRDAKGRFFINEANSIPGFTPISFYPKLWEVSGISYQELIEMLIQSALNKHKRRSLLKSTI